MLWHIMPKHLLWPKFGSKAEAYLGGALYCDLLSALAANIRLRPFNSQQLTDSGISCQSIYSNLIFGSNAEVYLGGTLYDVLLVALFTRIRQLEMSVRFN